VTLLPYNIGLHRAERLMFSFFEERNHQKAISRLGEKDFGICHTEKLLLLNSYALTVGCPENKLPYQVTAPRKHSVEEYMGFAHCSEWQALDVSNPTDSDSAEVEYGSDDNNEEDAVANDVDEEPIAHRETDDLLSDQLGDDLDIEVFATEEEYNAFLERDTRHTEDLTRLDEVDEAAGRHDTTNREAIEKELRRLLPTANGRESTIEAFQRLTNQNAWIPFRDPNSATPHSAIDRAEAELYDEWMSEGNPRYSLSVLSGCRSFKAFERDWNNEVTRRFRLWSREGDEATVQLRYKSKLQLQQHYNRMAEIASLRARLPQDEDHRRNLDEQLRTNRLAVDPAPTPEDTTPPTYNGDGITPFGCPTRLNAEVSVGAIRRANPTQNTQRAPFGVNLTRPPTAVPSRPKRRRFRSRKYCIKCGFLRSDHVRTDEGVANTCTRHYCGKCRIVFDEHGNNGFGPTCTNPTHQWQATTVADWFEEVSCITVNAITVNYN
jgi:hypothetical protein